MIASTASAVLARLSPAAAVTLWPWSATALAERANEHASQADLDPDRFDRARELAGRALHESLLSPVAARALGTVSAATRDHPAAERWFGLSNILSRRDLPSRLWLVQDALLHNDLPGAIRHIDVALSTSTAAATVLVPLLVDIAAYPQVARPLATRLAQRPVWTGEFVIALVAQQPANRSLARLVLAMHLDITNESDRVFAGQVLARLVVSREFAQAEALYRSLVPGGPFGVLRNGDFERAFALAPFDWGGPESGRVQRNLRSPRHSQVLYLLPGEAGLYVQQIQMLAPGRYRLSFVAGTDGNRPGVPPSLAVTCFGAQEHQIASAPLPQASQDGSAPGTLDFTVPAADCPAQWVQLVQPQPSNPSSSAFWIDDIGLARAPNQSDVRN